MSEHDSSNGIGEQEEWRNVIGFEGYYQVSDLGRVKSLTRTVPMKDGRQYRVGEKILRSSWDGHYFHVVLSKSGSEFVRLIHRLVLEAFVGPCPEGHEACHNDGDARNNRLDNLRWDTRESNVLDKIKHGTMRGIPPGEEHWNCKLTEQDVREIREAVGVQRNIAAMYGISDATMRDIKRRKSWRHLK